MTDPGDHDADPADHDGPIPVITMLRSWRSPWSETRTFSNNPAHGDAVAQLLEESAWFIEWTAADAPVETRVLLLACQREIVRWRRSWNEVWASTGRRAEIAERSGIWSEQLLAVSGLVGGATQGPPWSDSKIPLTPQVKELIGHGHETDKPQSVAFAAGETGQDRPEEHRVPDRWQR
jgi:hypothetical protein